MQAGETNQKLWYKNIDWVNTLFLTLTPPLAVITIWAHVAIEGFNPWLIIPFFVMYFATGLAITAGYHRLLSHKAYRAHPVIKFLYLFFGAGTFQNSALKWCHDHRIHHKHCDHDHDPYNIQKGFFFAHMGWIMLKDPKAESEKNYPKDLLNDRLVWLQHRYYLPIAVFVGFGIPALIGWAMGSIIGGLAIVGFARIVFVHHMTFFINSLCHMVGGQPYTDTNSAKDSPIMALFSYGEGYHNFHHYFQSDYRNGIRWYHFDPTKWLIAGLAKLGLTTALKRTSEEDILRAKLHMEHKQLLQKRRRANTAPSELQTLVQKIDAHLQQLIVLKRQWKNPTSSSDLRTQAQEKMQQVQRELSEWLNEWSKYTNSSLRLRLS